MFFTVVSSFLDDVKKFLSDCHLAKLEIESPSEDLVGIIFSPKNLEMIVIQM